MAKQMKSVKLKLAKKYFDDLPPSYLNNMEDFKFFENFAAHDTMIEIFRVVKYQVLGQISEI